MQGFLVVLCAARLGKEQFRFAVKNGEGRPEPLRISYLFRHERRMLGQSGDWSHASAYIESRNASGQQEAHRKKEEGDAAKAVEHSVRSQGRNRDHEHAE